MRDHYVAVAGASMLLIAGAAIAEDKNIFIGDEISVKLDEAIGCPKTDDLEKIIQLLREEDTWAAVAAKNRAGCRFFGEGESGIVRDLTVLSQFKCVRFRGDPACYWIVGRLLEVTKSIFEKAK
jgi:hypothetical protein